MSKDLRGVFIQKNSPFYWIVYYDKLEPNPKKRCKYINTKIEVTKADRERKKEGKRLLGTPELKRLVKAFRFALAKRNIEYKINYKLEL